MELANGTHIRIQPNSRIPSLVGREGRITGHNVYADGFIEYLVMFDEATWDWDYVNEDELVIIAE